MEFIRKHALEDAMEPNDHIRHAALVAASDPKVQNNGDGHISLKLYADILKSATVCIPTIYKDPSAKSIQEWSQGMPERKEKKEGDGKRSGGMSKEEIVQWVQNINKPKCVGLLKHSTSDSMLVNKTRMPTHKIKTLWDMINNVLDQMKNVGKITDKIIDYIDKEKEVMLEEEANI